MKIKFNKIHFQCRKVKRDKTPKGSFTRILKKALKKKIFLIKLISPSVKEHRKHYQIWYLKKRMKGRSSEMMSTKKHQGNKEGLLKA
jgi:hypothetical protein